MSGRADVWASGAAYEPYVGRWSRLVAAEYLPWLDADPGGTWLDLGCGTGAVTAAVLRYASPKAVIGVDASAGFAGYAQAAVTDPKAAFAVGTATALPIRDGTVDTVVSGLVLNFVPVPGQALAEVARVLRTGGIASAYVWDYAEGMQLMRYFWDAAGALDPSVENIDEALRFPLCRPGPLRSLFSDAGLTDVVVEPIEIATRFQDFEDYWTPFLGGQGPAPTYAMSLSVEARSALRESLRDRLPYAADGSIPLTARAWAVRGRK